MTINSDIEVQEPNQNNNNYFRLVMFLSIMFSIFMTWLIAGKLINQIDAWEVLKGKSEAHNVLVGAYRGCRDKFLSGGSIEECQLVVKEYAELKSMEAELPVVLEDISSLSEAILNGEL